MRIGARTRGTRVFCPTCGTQLLESAATCPTCSRRFDGVASLASSVEYTIRGPSGEQPVPWAESGDDAESAGRPGQRNPGTRRVQLSIGAVVLPITFYLARGVTLQQLLFSAGATTIVRFRPCGSLLALDGEHPTLFALLLTYVWRGCCRSAPSHSQRLRRTGWR